MGKKNRSNNKPTPTINSVTPAISTTNILSPEDKELLELAKIIKDEGDKDLNSLIQRLAEKANEEYKQVLEHEKENFIKKLEDDNASKIEENKDLEKKLIELREEKRRVEDFVFNEKTNTELTCNKMKDKAEKEAAEITKRARDKAQSDYQDEVNDIKKQKADIENQLESIKKEREQIAEDKRLNEKTLEDDMRAFKREKEIFEEEIEDRKEAVERLKKRLENKTEAIENEKIADLETNNRMLKESVENWRKEYDKLSAQKNELELIKAKTEGYTIEELQQERERLTTELEDLQNKFSEYTDLKLSEMKLALEEKPKYIEQINRLQSDIASKELELSRRANVQLEYEQLKEQLGLLRSLNEHLRTELSTTKKMLESSTGDVCPALTQIDTNIDSDKELEIKKSRDNIMSQPSNLNEIVSHIVNYAASRSKPLFYSNEDIKAFIAGMAASPFTILQGMSGTGKTSLPRIFAEAIFGEVNIVPVESSWRDRNELLGYYNDFSKKYTAKEFTCDLYKANTPNYRRVPYFIVLDEMNLSRVEYYFADFLSVLENEPKDWKVQLVETDMRQLPNEITPEVRDALEKDDSTRYKELRSIVDKLYPSNGSLDSEAIQNAQAGEKQKLLQFLEEKHFKNIHDSASLVTGPQLLENGKTISIPENVWFIGTANKDESTFEITDKVYDRAQVLNFKNRASGEKKDIEVDRKFISYDSLKSLFAKAKSEYTADCSNTIKIVINDIDSYLREQFRISFGNRILDQINKFVPVYVAASFVNKPHNNDELNLYICEALDYQITNKVLRKLEYVDMSTDQIDKLEEKFKKYHLDRAKDFLETKKEK